MSALAVAHGPASAISTVERLLSTVPHRGEHLRTVAVGKTVLGVAGADDPQDAWLFNDRSWAVALVGNLDLGVMHKALRRLGNNFDPPPDPASALLPLWHALGPEQTIRLLRGQFSGAVTDGERLWCFRDHIGFETMFYTQRGAEFFCASESKQLLRGLRMEAEPNVDFVERMFYGEELDELETSFVGIARLPKRSFVSVDGDEHQVRSYWDPSPLLETGPKDLEEIRERFDVLMAQAVSRTLTGNDIISLSGGIDSPAVAAFAAPLHVELFGRPLESFTVVFPDHPTADERRYVELIAKTLELPVHMHVVGPNRLGDLSEWVELFDGPWPIWNPEAAAGQLRAVRSLGFTNMLNGHLAEFVMDEQNHLVPHLLLQGRWADAATRLRAQRRSGKALTPLVRHAVGAFVPGSLHRFYARKRPRVVAPLWIDAGRLIRDRAQRIPPTREGWRRHQLNFLDGPGVGLEAWQIMQARLGVRERSPWGDVDLWEFFLTLPAEVKYPNPPRKALVRQLLRGRLPDVVLDRQDKTVANEYIVAEMDYPALRKWLTAPKHRITGIDYKTLQAALDDERLDLTGYMWAKELAVVHAFMDQW